MIVTITRRSFPLIPVIIKLTVEVIIIRFMVFGMTVIRISSLMYTNNYNQHTNSQYTSLRNVNRWNLFDKRKIHDIAINFPSSYHCIVHFYHWEFPRKNEHVLYSMPFNPNTALFLLRMPNRLGNWMRDLENAVTEV